MTNPSARPRVPLLVALVALVTGCAPHAGGVETRQSVPSPTVEIVNQSGERIDVYLVTETQDWRLGRLEPLAKARLPLPAAALASTRGKRGMIRLAALPGATGSLQPSRESRAVLTLKQPVDAFASQQWVFAAGQLVPLSRPRPGAP